MDPTLGTEPSPGSIERRGGGGRRVVAVMLSIAVVALLAATALLFTQKRSTDRKLAAARSSENEARSQLDFVRNESKRLRAACSDQKKVGDDLIAQTDSFLASTQALTHAVERNDEAAFEAAMEQASEAASGMLTVRGRWGNASLRCAGSGTA